MICCCLSLGSCVRRAELLLWGCWPTTWREDVVQSPLVSHQFRNWSVMDRTVPAWHGDSRRLCCSRVHHGASKTLKYTYHTYNIQILVWEVLKEVNVPGWKYEVSFFLLSPNSVFYTVLYLLILIISCKLYKLHFCDSISNYFQNLSSEWKENIFSPFIISK